MYWDFGLQTKTWFRESTNEWVYEFDISYNACSYNCRWSNKHKPTAIIRGQIQMLIDLTIILIKGLFKRK